MHEQSGNKGCYDLAFLIEPANTGEARTYLDLLLANEVVRPVLYKYLDSIQVWWFHRRWGRAREGPKLHEFKFTLFCTEQVARTVEHEIKAQPVLQALDGVTWHAPEREDRGLEAAAQDAGWPDRQGWTFFIHSVSLLWLRLILRHVGNAIPDSLKAREAMYRTVEKCVLRDWEQHAGHALLHHLNAVFGYEATAVLTISKFLPLR